MPPDDADRARRLIEHSLLLPTEQRAAYLDAACASDPRLRRAVDRLLSGDGRAAADRPRRRGRRAFAATVLALAAAGGAVGLWLGYDALRHEGEQHALALAQHRQAARERDAAAARARHQAVTAAAGEDALRLVLLDIEQATARDVPRGQTSPARQAIDRAAARLIHDGTSDPGERAARRHAIGAAYRALGYWEQARKELEPALDARRALLRAPHPDLVATMHALADALVGVGQVEAAGKLYAEALEQARTLHGGDSPQAAALLDALGNTLALRGRTGEALPLLRQAVEAYRATVVREPVLATSLASALGSVGSALAASGDAAGAMAAHRESLDLLALALGEGHPEWARALLEVGRLQRTAGDLRAAEVSLGRALAALTGAYGQQKRADVARAHHELALLYAARKDHAAAARASMEAASMALDLFGPDHPASLAYTATCAFDAVRVGRADDADGLLDRIYRRLPETPQGQVPSRQQLARRAAEAFAGEGYSGLSSKWRARAAAP